MTAEEMTMAQELVRKQQILALVNDPDTKKKDVFIIEQLYRHDDDMKEVKGDIKELKQQYFKLPFKIDKKRVAGVTTLILGVIAAIAEFC